MLIYTLLIIFCSYFSFITATIYVYSQKSWFPTNEFIDALSRFGQEVPNPVLSYLVYGSPSDGCTKLKPPPSNVTNFTNQWAVLINKDGCTYEEKIKHAQLASYDIVIVHNVNSSDVYPMTVKNPAGIFIISMFVSESSGIMLRDNYQYKNGFHLIIDDDTPFAISHLLIPLILVVVLSFVSFIGFWIVKCVRDWRRSRRHRVPYSSLCQIPTVEYSENDPYDTCAICLENFVKNERLRVLPCSHAYHTICIDPWLSRSSKVCPVCKRRAYDNQNSDDSSSDDDDNTPLITERTRSYGGTFLNQRPVIHINSTPSTSSNNLPRSSSNNLSQNSSSSSEDYRPANDLFDTLLYNEIINNLANKYGRHSPDHGNEHDSHSTDHGNKHDSHSTDHGSRSIDHTSYDPGHSSHSVDHTDYVAHNSHTIDHSDYSHTIDHSDYSHTIDHSDYSHYTDYNNYGDDY